MAAKAFRVLFTRPLVSSVGVKHVGAFAKKRMTLRMLFSGTMNADVVPLPQYEPRKNEDVEVKRARLLYQSRKRGMLENGLLLSCFANKHLALMSPNQLDQYDYIINLPSNDWDIYYWITGKDEVPAEYDNEVMRMMQEFARNKNMEERLRQPDLLSTKGTQA